MKIKINLFFAEFGLLLVSILFFTIFNTQPVSAYSLTVTTSGPLSTDITPIDNNASANITTDEINIVSNCRSGYTFTIVGPSNNNLYLDGDNTTSTYFTPVNGTTALNSAGNINKWGYSLTANTETGIFNPLTSTETTLKTPSQTSSPDADIDTIMPIYYGAAADGSMNPGSYTFANNGTISYIVTMDPSCTLYSVQYQSNGADNPNGMGTTDESTGEKSVRQTNLSEGTVITLLAPNFKKQGYGFLGWSTDENAYTHFADNDNTNDPIIYGPNETITITSDIIATATAKNQINMYAVWIPALKSDPSNPNSTPVYFQDWDNPNTLLPHDGCSTLTATVFDDTETNEKDKIKVVKDSVVALTDKRDNEVYTVAKLADGKCWMVENLRLDADYTMGQNQNDPTVTNQYLSQGYGGTTGTYGNFVGLAESETANFSNNATANLVYKSAANLPVDKYNEANHVLEDIGTTNEPTRRLPRYNNTNTSNPLDNPVYIENYSNPSYPSTSGVYNNSSIISYGNTNYYRESSASEVAGTSLCPSGWMLPTGGSDANKDFVILSKSYGGTGSSQSGTAQSGDIMSKRIHGFPNNFTFSGHYANSSTGERGNSSIMWTRTTGPYVAFFFSSSKTSIGPNSNNDYKFRGYTIRCNMVDSNIEITLDSNNSMSSVSRIYGTSGSSIALPQSSISEPGYGFKNWNTASDGSGTAYTTSYAIPADSTGETLYAQWDPQYTIVYLNNCQSYASTNPSCTQTASDSAILQKINLDTSGAGSGTLKSYNAWTTLSGWKIVGWNTAPDGTGTEYKYNSSYSITGQNPGDNIVLYAHWIPLYTIQYDGNNADNPNGMGIADANGIKSVKQTNVCEGEPVDLLPSNFKRAGYGFAGWSTNPQATVSSGDKIYGPSEIISAPAYPNNATNTITMYAVWVPAETNGSEPVYFQDWHGCSTLTPTDFDPDTGTITAGDVIALTDKRDNEVYTVARLADNNCWMIENLRLNHGSTIGNNINDPNVTNQSLSQGYGGTPGVYGMFVGLAESETIASSTNSNSIYQSSANPPIETYDPIAGTLEDISSADNPVNRFPRYNYNNTNNMIDGTTYTKNYINASSPSASGNYISSTLFSYGNYYTWNAAIANTNHYIGENDSDNIGTSLCPTGWHLPSGGGKDKEYGTLSQSYGGTGNNQAGIANAGDIMFNRFSTFPNNFLLSGSSYHKPNSTGRYWSRTSWNSTNANSFVFGTTYFYPVEHYGKNSGYSIRCLIGS